MEAEMKLDDAVLEELERGEGTAIQIIERLSGRVRHALERLEKGEKVVRNYRSGELIFSLPQLPINRRV
jgi:N-acetylglucosamine kinase-like BadF-type ATPase